MGTGLTDPTTVTIAGWREILAVPDLEGRDERCRAFVEALRWPSGVRCPRCESGRTSRVPSRRQIDCRDCRYRFSVTSRTHLHDSAVPLWKWLVAVSLFVESGEGFPAHRLADRIGVSYKTAWSLGHRIRAAVTAGAGSSPNGTAAAPAGYHQVSPKYLAVYRAESEWRARNRGNPDAFADALRALLASPHA